MKPSQASFIPHVRHLFIMGIILASCDGGGPTGPSSSLSLSTTSIAFSIFDDQRAVTLQNLGNGSTSWTVLSSTSWVKLSPSTGTLGPRSSGSFSVQLDRSGLAKGTYSASVQVVSGGEVQTIDISVEQGDPAQAVLQPTSISIGEQDDSTVVEIRNSGGSTLNWSLSTPALWVTLSPSSGSLPPGAIDHVTVRSLRTGLIQGHYQGLLYLSSNGGSVTAGLSMDVGQAVGLHLEPTSLSFGLSLTEMPIQIVNDGHEDLTWSAQSGAPWLSLSSRP